VIPEKNDLSKKKRIAPVVLVTWAVLLIPLGLAAGRYMTWGKAQRALEEQNQRKINASYDSQAVAFELKKVAASGDAAAFAAVLRRLPGDPNRQWTGARTVSAVLDSVDAGHTSIIQYWIDQGWPTKAGAFPSGVSILSECLKHAATSEHPEVVRFLLDKGADPNYGDSLLLAALRKTDAAAKITLMLIDAGADLNKAFTRRTPFPQSPTGPSPASTKMGDGDARGFTPIMLAARNGRADVVRALLAKGAEVWLQNPKGQTAQGIAEEQGHKQVAALLAETSKTQPKPGNVSALQKTAGPLRKRTSAPSITIYGGPRSERNRE
jgi:hypothetical protein